jgi:ANTAR domain/GAF domain
VPGARGGYCRFISEAGSNVDTNEVVELSREFAQLGRELRGEGDNDAALQRMVQLAVKYIEPCTGASITVIQRGVGRSLATSDGVAARADTLQYELGEGPCLRSAERDNNYLLFDVATDSRWPRFCAALAEQTAYRCVLSFQLEAQDSAALNLFAEHPGAFSDDDVDLATVFAAHTTSLVALHEAEDHAAHLEVALQTNREIGAAIGVLMAHHKVTQDDAFSLLRTASQTLHRKLRDVASEVVATGTLPDPT